MSNDFRTVNASWFVKRADRTSQCSTSGHGVIANVQEMLANALRAPWGSYDGSHSTRPVPDGNWGPITNAALWTYAGLKGASRGTLDAIRAVAGTKKITLPVLQFALWLAYYQPRIVDRDVGGVRQQLVEPPLEGVVSSADLVTFPADTIPPTFGQRPEIPTERSGLGAVEPTCVDTGPTFTLGQTTGPDLPDVRQTSISTTVETSGGGGGAAALGALVLVGIGFAASKRKKGRR